MKLKLERRLVEEKLKRTDHKMEVLGGILDKKMTQRAYQIAPEDAVVTNKGMTVGELRNKKNSIKAVPKVVVHDPYAMKASVVNNPELLEIRMKNQVKSTGGGIVKQRIKAKTLADLKAEKKPKIIPNISIPASMLPNRYIRGELPCTIEHGTAGKYLSWACPLENLDYEYYLPLFFDGLQVKEPVVAFIARQGVEDMLFASKGHPERIKSVVHLLARPLRNALGKFDTELLLASLKAIEQLVTCNEGVGEVLMPFGKQFLAPISFFMDEKKNIGDSIDYGQRRGDDIGEEIRKVLELMEEHGGPNALRAIQFSIPLYQSCIKRPDAHHHMNQH